MFGKTYIPFSHLLAGGQTRLEQRILWELRLPTVLTAILAGGGLSLAGLIMQTYFRNPIAGPYIQGVSSGASLGVAFLVLMGGGVWAWSMVGAGFLGSIAVFLLVLIAATKVKDSAMLLILGLMVGAATGAIVNLLQFYSSEQALQRFVFWSMGSLQGLNLVKIGVIVIVVIPVLFVMLTLARFFDVWLLGETYSSSVGVPVRLIRVLTLVMTAAVAAAVTIFCGPIAFVGIMVPHLARFYIKTYRHIYLIPTTFLLGAVILLLCQWLSQTVAGGEILPINIITSLVGAPFVVFLTLKSRT